MQAAKDLRDAEGSAEQALGAMIENKKAALSAAKQAGSLSRAERAVRRRTVAALEQLRDELPVSGDLMTSLRTLLTDRREAVKKAAAQAGAALENTFAFCEKAFGEGQELLILVTELTAESHSARFIARYGSEGYYRHNKALLVYERQETILREIETLGGSGE